jgi:hypothetical protein
MAVHETCRMRGWTPSQWRDISKRDQTEIVAYEMRRAKDRAKTVDERIHAMGKGLMATDYLLLEIWRGM